MSTELFDDIKLYLPKYLSDADQEKLFAELSKFPENIDSRFYTQYLKDEPSLFQGDGFNEVIYPDYASQQFRPLKGFMLSNTCDSYLGNTRMYAPFISFAPIFSLKKWEQKLLSKFSVEAVQSHIEAIKKQRITQFLYLPPLGDDEMFARFDCAFSIPASEDLNKELLQKRFFTLSNYGFYVMLLKIGIHLTRVQERVNRDIAPSQTVH